MKVTNLLFVIGPEVMNVYHVQRLNVRCWPLRTVYLTTMAAKTASQLLRMVNCGHAQGFHVSHQPDDFARNFLTVVSVQLQVNAFFRKTQQLQVKRTYQG